MYYLAYYMAYTKSGYEKSANSFKPQCTGKDTMET